MFYKSIKNPMLLSWDINKEKIWNTRIFSPTPFIWCRQLKRWYIVKLSNFSETTSSVVRHQVRESAQQMKYHFAFLHLQGYWTNKGEEQTISNLWKFRLNWSLLFKYNKKHISEHYCQLVPYSLCKHKSAYILALTVEFLLYANILVQR